MHRRKLIKRIGAASTLTLGASGLAAAGDDGGIDAAELTHARVQNQRGEIETVQLSELARRHDLPSPDDLSAVGGDVGTEDCCCDGCTNCICCIC